MPTKLTYTGAEVQELLDKIEKGDFDNAKTLEGHPASYFAIESEFTSLAESFATEQGRVDTLCGYFNNGSANDALSLGGQLPSYYATALQYEILQQTLTDFKSLFDSMFEKDSDGNIHAKLPLWSSGGITAGDAGSGGSGGGGISYNRLDSWSDYSADKSGWVLSALLGKDLDNRVSALANAGYITASYLAPYALRSEIPSLVGYATQSWVGDNFLSKSGGTLTDALTVKGSGSPLTVHRTQPFASVVKFVNTDGNLGWLGVDIDKTAIFMEASGVIKKLLHSGNYSDYALSKNGGTVNGPITATSFIGGTSTISGDLKGLQNLIFADGYLGRKFSLTNSGGIFYQAPSGSVGWATNWNVKSNDGITSFGDLGGAFGVGNSLSYFYYGGEYNAPSIAIMPSGMIAIGGTTADEKLHVHGNGKFTGALTSPAITTHTLKVGNVTLVEENGALKVIGGFIATGGVTSGEKAS